MLSCGKLKKKYVDKEIQPDFTYHFHFWLNRSFNVVISFKNKI